MGRGRDWTDEEIQYLEENVGKQSYVRIGKVINRTSNAINKKATALGINYTKKESGLYTISLLCKILKIDRNTINRWIKNHGFPAKKKVLKVSQKTTFIEPKDFWQWAYDNKERLNFYAIERDAIVPEPDWVEEQRRVDFLKSEEQKKQFIHPFIKAVKEARLELGLSHRQVTKDLDVSRSHLSAIENNSYEVSVPYGLMLCEYYGVDIELFVDYKKHMIVKEIQEKYEEMNPKNPQKVL